jgi:protease II
LEISRGFTQVIWYDKNNLKSRVSLSSSSSLSSDLRYRLPFEDPAFNIAIYPKYVDWKNHTIDIEYSSPRVPTSYYKFKWASSSSSLKHNTDNMKIIEIVGGLTNKFDSALYTSKMGFATSKDGIKIPYITVARRDIHPRSKSAEDCAEIVAAASATDIGVNARGLLICGYGSYGMLLSLNFTPWISYLIDRGFVFCGAMIRGGGECGFSWYEEGRNTAK